MKPLVGHMINHSLSLLDLDDTVVVLSSLGQQLLICLLNQVLVNQLLNHLQSYNQFSYLLINQPLGYQFNQYFSYQYDL